MSAGQAHILMEMGRHEASVRASISRAGAATTLQDLVRVANHQPQPAAFLRCLGNIRSAGQRLQTLIERRADELVSQRLKSLQASLGQEQYCVEAVKLRQELRHLAPSASRVVSAALRSMDAMERSAASDASGSGHQCSRQRPD